MTPSRGSIRAVPNPVNASGRSGAVDLVWTLKTPGPIEVHVDAPDGPLFTIESETGHAVTGPWVRDGMTFFLQDALAEAPGASTATLDSVKVRVRPKVDAIHEVVAYLGQRFGCTRLVSLEWAKADDLSQLVPHFAVIERWDLASIEAPASTEPALESTLVLYRGVFLDGAGRARLVDRLEGWLRAAPVAVVALDCGRRRGGELLDDVATAAADLERALSARGANVVFTGASESHPEDPQTIVAIVERPSAPIPPTPPGFRVTAIITAYNEADIVVSSVERLLKQDVAVHFVDNWSTDGTYELASRFEGREGFSIERFPAEGATNTFELGRLLARCETIATEIPCDWFILHDVDEVRSSPWPGVGLRDALYRVDQEGFNAVDHTVLEFRPTDDTFSPGEDPEARLRWFEFGHRSDHFMQVKAWKNSGQRVALAGTGGHEAQFAERRIYPYKFLLKHYPVRSQAHGERKVFTERKSRWDAGERSRGWHQQYDSVAPGASFLRTPSSLERYEVAQFNITHLIPRISGVGIPVDPDDRSGQSDRPREPVSVEPASPPSVVLRGIPRVRRLVRNSYAILRIEGLRGFISRVRARLSSRTPAIKIAPSERRTRPFSLAAVDAPVVSIIVPAHNQSLFTFNCLLSIARNTQDVPYEVIVVDDGSGDDTPEVLRLIENVRVVRNDPGVGFVGACNAGAAQARGRFLLFLNNDTLVTPGWLAPLVGTFDQYPRCGAVGPKVVYPDGKLQEAGGIVWRDGRGWNYGKFDDAAKPSYNYLRQVDYCSGCALMVRRELFERLGGFDQRYAPGYWEDVDLCFGLRSIGYDVLYQPASCVAHFEGQTAGRELTEGMKRYQIVNGETFRAKWVEALRGQAAFDNFFRASDRSGGRTFLVLDHSVPMHDKDAGSLFMFTLLAALRAEDHRVVFWPDNHYRLLPYSEELQQLGVEVQYGDLDLPSYLRRYGPDFDAALVYRTHVAAASVGDLKRYVRSVAYLICDLESLRERRRVEVEGGGTDAIGAFERTEADVIRQVDRIVVHSPAERDLIVNDSAPPVSVLPLPVREIALTASAFADRSGLLFVGSAHPPNADAVEYFASLILPRLRSRLGVERLTVVGEVERLVGSLSRSGALELVGHVPQLEPYYSRARVVVVPLRYGAGLKGKVLEALASGVPVVTTSVGAEGIGLTDGVTAMIADGETAFAEAIERLYTDPDLWASMRHNARALIDREYSVDRFRARVSELVNQL